MYDDPSIQDFKRIPFSDLTCITSNTRSLELPDEKLSTESINLIQSGIAHVGSVVVCRVESIGAHKEVENRSGRLVRLSPDDLIMGVMGNRHSTTSVYGGLPKSGIELPREEPIDLLSYGGVIGECYSCPSYLGSPTKLRILGFVSQEGKPLEIIPQIRDEHLQVSCPFILIAGTSATVGKTKFASKLIHFITHGLGRTVAATKLAGAGELADLLNLRDAGARYIYDFIDAGLVTTYVPSEKPVEVAKGILNHLAMKKPEVIIAELGGDILGANVPAILADEDIRHTALAMILVPSDILAAFGAINYLQSLGFPTNKVYIGQPIKNIAASQERAWKVIDRRLYDCENMEDLGSLVEEMLGWRHKKEEQDLQTEEQVELHPIMVL